MQKLGWKIILIAAVTLIAVFYTFPLSKRINLGLDLQGGMHLVLRVDTTELPAETSASDITDVALEIIRNRIDQFGVREPVIQRQGIDQILVQLPGITDRDRALDLIGKTALLEFRLVSERDRLLQRALDGDVPRGFDLLEDVNGTPYLLEKDGSLTGAILSNAWVEAGDLGLPQINFQMTREGSRLFGRMTGSNINRRLAIVLDDVVQSAPVIQSRISDSGRITGQFTTEQSHDLAIILRAGALPAPIIVEEERTVGPTLGRDSIRAGVTAISLAGLLVMLFMVGYYLISGVVAVFALGLNFLLILGGLGYFGATLTLPGLAGMLLTLGMAVDANVLTFERIREEIQAGRPLSLSISTGYEKALSAIVDSNVTTLVAALFLYWFGTGPIRGFATTLGIGIMASLFTSLFVTRVVFEVLLNTQCIKRLRMFQIIGKTKFDFIGKRYICWGISLVVICIGMAAFVMRGDARYGVDFRGGMLQEYRFTESVDAHRLRESLRDAGLDQAVIQRFGPATEWLIRTGDQTDKEIRATISKTGEALQRAYPEANPQLVRLERVGPAIGKILRQKAWLAILWSMLGIVLYVAVRFRHLDVGLAAVVALIHDVVVAVGFLCIIGRGIDMVIVAALMTIAGYSVNDTIVVYDRVRENEKLNRKVSFKELLNISVNQTLSRTVLTSFTTLIVVIALFFVGGEVLRAFSLALIIGFISGVYSSIYIASGFVVIWRNLVTPKRA